MRKEIQAEKIPLDGFECYQALLFVTIALKTLTESATTLIFFRAVARTTYILAYTLFHDGNQRLGESLAELGVVAETHLNARLLVIVAHSDFLFDKRNYFRLF